MTTGPILHLHPQPPHVTAASIRALVDLLVDVERKIANGPWDEWDGVVLEQWREIVRRRLTHALAEIDRGISTGAA